MQIESLCFQADEPERKVSFGKPPPAPVTSKPEESDWDTTEAPTPRSAAGTNKMPLSARVRLHYVQKQSEQ